MDRHNTQEEDLNTQKNLENIHFRVNFDALLSSSLHIYLVLMVWKTGSLSLATYMLLLLFHVQSLVPVSYQVKLGATLLQSVGLHWYKTYEMRISLTRPDSALSNIAVNVD